MKTRLTVWWGCLSLVLAFGCATARGALYSTTYNGNGQTDGIGVIGNGHMTIADDGGSTFSTTVTPGYTLFPQNLVIYIDSQAGGFANTADFGDTIDSARRAISGFNQGGYRATANFAPGFQADYAIVLSPNAISGLYRLASGGTWSLQQLAGLSINNANGQYQFNINWSDIGLSGDAAHYFRFQSSYVSSMGSRYLESFETLTGVRGYNTTTFDYWNSFGVEPVPEPVNAALALFGGLAVVTGVVARARRSGRAGAGHSTN